MSYFHHAVARLILSTFHPQVLDIQMVPALIGGSREGQETIKWSILFVFQHSMFKMNDLQILKSCHALSFMYSMTDSAMDNMHFAEQITKHHLQNVVEPSSILLWRGSQALSMHSDMFL